MPSGKLDVWPCSARAEPVAERQPRVNGPLIVQSDKTLLLEVDHEQADDCRRVIAPFAELERAPNTSTPTA